MSRARVLVVSYPYPPMPSTGANRWAAMSTYLRALGYDVRVVTTSAFGSLPADDAEHVTRVNDLIASRALRRVLRRPPLPQPGAAVPDDKPPPALVTRVVVPDIYAVTWVPAALRAVRAMLRCERFDCLITTSPYESGHLVGLALGSRRPPWITDFRDAWTFEPYRAPFPTRLQRALDARLEQAVVSRADRVVGVHRTLVDDFERRFGVVAAHVPNGWDPALDKEVERATPPTLSPDKVSLVHAGTLWGEWGRDPDALFQALRHLRGRYPDVAERLELVLAGRLDVDERERLERSGLDDLVRIIGPLSRAESVALQRHADALLLLTSRRLSWEAPGKLFEYLAAGRPILALAENNEAARVVDETGTGVTVPPDDPDAIAAALEELLDSTLTQAYQPRGVERYRYPEVAESMAALVDLVAATR